MYTTLTNLFNGNLNLSERTPSDFPMRKHHQKEYDRLKGKLDGMLNEEGQGLLNELLEAKTSVNIYSDYGSFASGFRLATLLMVEVFYDKDSLFYDR